MRRIDDNVGVGWIVDGGDLTVPDTNRVLDDLDHGREAVGRTRGSGEQPMACGIIELIVDADDNVQRIRVFHRGRHDHPLHAALEIRLQLLWRQKLARAFKHDIATEIAPRHLARQTCRGKSDVMLANRDRSIVFGCQAGMPPAMNTIELEQMRGRGNSPFSSLT